MPERSRSNMTARTEEGIEHLYAKRHSSAIPNWQMMME
jgi:hypothetical protein